MMAPPSFVLLFRRVWILVLFNEAGDVWFCHDILLRNKTERGMLRVDERNGECWGVLITV